MIGDKNAAGPPADDHLAARGWVCVATNYRLSPSATFPDHLIDVKRALAWVREHIAEYGGDPDFVVVTGGSAGGHLSALVGAHRERAASTSRASRTPTPRCAARPVLRRLRLRRPPRPARQRGGLTPLLERS